MALTTAGDLIALALRTAGITGVGQTPSADDTTDCLAFLSMMVAQWQQKRWLTWSLTETVVPSTGAQTYTVGLGQNVNIVRPDKFDSAFVRVLTNALPTDYPVVIVPSREDYNRICLKTLTTWPGSLYYETAYPVGILHFWPVPTAGIYEMHLFSKAALPVYTALTTPLGLPPEYLEAALYSLTARIQVNYGQSIAPGVASAMFAALDVLATANLQLAEMRMPGGLPGMRRFSSVSADVNPAFLTGTW